MKINLFQYNEKLAFQFKVGDIKSNEDKELIADMIGTIHEARGRGLIVSIEIINELLSPYKKDTQLGFSAIVNKQGSDIDLLMFTFDKENKINQVITIITND